MIWSSVGRELSCSLAGGAEAASESCAGFEDPWPVADVEDTEGRGICLLDSVASAQWSVGFTSPVECCGCDSAPSTWCSEACVYKLLVTGKVDTSTEALKQKHGAAESHCSSLQSKTTCMVNAPGPVLMCDPANSECHLPSSTSSKKNHAD